MAKPGQLLQARFDQIGVDVYVWIRIVWALRIWWFHFWYYCLTRSADPTLRQTTPRYLWLQMYWSIWIIWDVFLSLIFGDVTEIDYSELGCSTRYCHVALGRTCCIWLTCHHSGTMPGRCMSPLWRSRCLQRLNPTIRHFGRQCIWIVLICYDFMMSLRR